MGRVVGIAYPVRAYHADGVGHLGDVFDDVFVVFPRFDVAGERIAFAYLLDDMAHGARIGIVEYHFEFTHAGVGVYLVPTGRFSGEYIVQLLHRNQRIGIVPVGDEGAAISSSVRGRVAMMSFTLSANNSLNASTSVVYFGMMSALA